MQGRADLVLAELKRTGAFDRKVLVIATTTGMGYLDSRGTDPLEYLWNGDTAIAGVQYSYLPSWISLLADQEAVVDTSQTVFETVRQYWATLPASERPSLYLYGLSLGSMGVESVLSSVNIVNEPVDGALMVGPPFLNEMHRRLERDRDAGSPASLPVYEDGRTVRFTNEQEPLQPVTGAWGPTRVAYLQHASDPVVFFSSDLAFDRPAWLADGQRGPDVSPTMGWVPLVTMWQVLLDMPGAGSVPTGYGHMYSARANLDGLGSGHRAAGLVGHQGREDRRGPREPVSASGQPSSRQRQNGCPAGSSITRTLSWGWWSASVAPSATASSTAESRSPTCTSRCIIGRCRPSWAARPAARSRWPAGRRRTTSRRGTWPARPCRAPRAPRATRAARSRSGPVPPDREPRWPGPTTSHLFVNACGHPAAGHRQVHRMPTDT